MMKSIRRIPPLVAVLLSGLLACSPQPETYHQQFLAFGTLMDLTIAGVPTAQAAAAGKALEDDFAVMHQAWHAWSPGPMTRTNALLAEGKSFSAPPSVLPLIKVSQRLAEQSDNLFNPAIGHLIKLWGFQSDEPNRPRPPPAAELIRQAIAKHPRMSDIIIDDFRLRSTNPAVQIDVGAIGKGYGIDIAIGHLRELGIDNAIINAGGDLRAIGRNGDRPWRIAIRGADGKGVLGYVETDGDESVFTSGDYERGFTWEGRHYHHIIDPRTGYPAQGTHSVTVLGDDATTADAAATALFVAGPDDWPRIAARMGIKDVLLVDSDGVMHMTPGMQQRLHLFDDGAKIRITPLAEPGP